MKKAFITGSNGQLGRELIKQLNELGIDNAGYDIPELDITDFDRSLELVRSEEPDVIINCAAMTNVDGCETDQDNAYRINALGAQNMARIASELDIPIVHVSTDYVFEGEDVYGRPLVETDPINPKSVYGSTKAEGEKLVREETDKNFIVRTAWLYGDGNNFVKTMLNLSDRFPVLTVVDDQIGSPTSTVDLAKAIIDLAQTDNYGTYHGTNEGVCSWADFAEEIFKIAGKDTKVTRVTSEEYAAGKETPTADRPKYSVLENKGLNDLGLNSFRDWKVSLKEYIDNLN